MSGTVRVVTFPESDAYSRVEGDRLRQGADSREISKENSMRNLRIGVVVAALLSCTTFVFAAPRLADKDPEKTLQEINAWYEAQIKKGGGKPSQDVTAEFQEREKKIQAALIEMSVEKTEPAKCLALARLYEMVHRWKEAIPAARKFVDSNPPLPQKYRGQVLLLDCYLPLRDIDGLLKALKDIVPATPQDSSSLAGSVGLFYAPLIADKKGVDTGLDLLKTIEGKVQFGALQKIDEESKKKAEEAKKPFASYTAYATSSLAFGRYQLYLKAGKKTEAEALLQETLKKLGPDSQSAKDLQEKIRAANPPVPLAKPGK
jgi:tetratricopeptide (TPR) repeat protein